MIKNIILILFLTFPFELFSQNLNLVINKSGKYGFTDQTGDTLIECKYDYAENFSGGLALVKNNLRFKLIDTTGKILDVKQYTGGQRFRHEYGENYSGLPVLIKQWDCFYITSSGETYLSIPYQDANSFIAGKAKVYDGDRYNFISKNGLLLNSWIPIEDDYHAIKNKEKYGYIDKNGKLVIDYIFTNAKDFHDNLAQISNGTYWALINKKGKRISDWYEEIDPFKGEITVVRKLGNIGFINKSGKFMGQWYKSIEPLEYGMYKVKKYEKYALINETGFLVTQWFDAIFDFKKGYIKVEKDGKFAYINKIGALVVGWYDNIGKIENGIIRVEDEGKSGFFNVESFFISEFYDYLGKFNEGLALVKQNDKYSYITKTGKIITPFQFDKAKPFYSGIAEVEKNGKATYINTKGNPIIDWYPAKKYSQKEPPKGIIAVKYGRKYGFETINGKRIISAKYDYAENFKEGLALVKNNYQEMYIDKNGKLVPKTEYPDNKDLRLDQGYAHTNYPITKNKWECSFIDYNGDIAIKLSNFDDANSFKNDKAKVFKGDKYNFINKKGKIIDSWKELSDEYHASEKNGKFGYINKNGEIIIPYNFDYAYDFENDFAKVRIGNRKTGKYALINKKGEFKTKKYDEIFPFKNKYALVKNNNKYTLIDTSGKEISQWYDKIYNFKEYYARVKLNNKYSFINYQGLQFRQWFDYADDFYSSRAKIKINNKWGFINKKGNIIIKTIYDNVWNYKNNIAKVEKNGKYAFIDLNGKTITSWFDRLFMFADDRAVVCIDNKWGYVDFNGKIIIPTIYNHAFAFSKGEAMVIKDGSMLKIDKNGNIIEKIE